MRSIRSDGCDKGIQLIFFLLQLLDKTLNGPFCEALALPSLSVAHEAVHDAQAGVIARGGVCD